MSNEESKLEGSNLYHAINKETWIISNCESDCKLLVGNLLKKTCIDHNENNGFITKYSYPMINFKIVKFITRTLFNNIFIVCITFYKEIYI